MPAAPPPLGHPEHSAAPTSAAGVRALETVLSTRGIRAVYQPLVELEQRQVVGYDALARGPVGSALELPGQLFEVARGAGRVGELDWTCRTAALQGALDAGLGNWLTLFMTVEPEVLGAPLPPEVELLLRNAEQRLRVVLEISERSLAMAPAELLRAVEWAHERYWGIALDDVGANQLSLSLLPFLRPDVIKLDLRMLQRLPAHEAAGVVKSVFAHVERTDAAILAEGIETEQQLELAVTLGATLGQGWLFGRPGPLPVGPKASRSTVRLIPAEPGVERRSPFALVTADRAARTGRGSLLAALVRHLESEAAGLQETPVVLASVPAPAYLRADVVERYEEMARAGALVGVVGRGLGQEPAAGVHGGAVDALEPLAQEWNLVVVSPTFAGAVVARELDDAGPIEERRFRFTVTYDRPLVVNAARSLMARLGPLHEPHASGPDGSTSSTTSDASSTLVMP